MSSHLQRKFCVLVVDDEPRVLESIAAVLSTEVDVVTCSSAEEALRLIESGNFHMVCADFKMVGMNGHELLDRVASMPLYTSCLLITGAEEYFRSKEGGSHHYVLLKPFDPARLVRLVVQLAQIAEMRRSVSSMTGTVGAPDSVAPPSSFRRPSTSSTLPPGRPPESGTFGAPRTSAPPASSAHPRASERPALADPPGQGLRASRRPFR